MSSSPVGVVELFGSGGIGIADCGSSRAGAFTSIAGARAWGELATHGCFVVKISSSGAVPSFAASCVVVGSAAGFLSDLGL